MAKRNKAEEPDEEEYQFIPPEFDEDQFIHKEMVSFHTTVILFFAGIVAALASWGAFTGLDGAKVGWLVGMVILAITFAFLRPLFRLLNVDIAHWARREWIGTGFLMFFTWLAFFIMLVNPPFSDFADPEANVYLTPETPVAGQPIVFDLFLHDNDGIDGYDARLTLFDGTPTDTPALQQVPGDIHHFSGDMTLSAGSYIWHVTARDDNGRTHDVAHEFTVLSNGLSVDVDPNAFYPVQATVPGDADDYWAVYATFDGEDRRVFLEYQEDADVWTATTKYEGWVLGNNTFTIVAEEKNHFEGNVKVAGAKLENGPHTLKVDAIGTYDDSIPKRGNKNSPDSVNIPGFEILPLIGGLVAVAFIARRQ